MKFSIDVEHYYTNEVEVAKEFLSLIKPDSLVACDFETAVKYSPEEIKEAELKSTDPNLTRRQQVDYLAIAHASALGHPHHCFITHFSFAMSENKGYVIVIDSDEIQDLVLNFLVTTTARQIWHNYCYDGKFIQHHTGKHIKNLEDSQILAKILLNHTHNLKSKSGLKHLCAAWYGSWAVSSDVFNLTHIYNENLVKYAAVDACATYKLWNELQNYLEGN